MPAPTPVPATPPASPGSRPPRPELPRERAQLSQFLVDLLAYLGPLAGGSPRTDLVFQREEWNDPDNLQVTEGLPLVPRSFAEADALFAGRNRATVRLGTTGWLIVKREERPEGRCYSVWSRAIGDTGVIPQLTGILYRGDRYEPRKVTAGLGSFNRVARAILFYHYGLLWDSSLARFIYPRPGTLGGSGSYDPLDFFGLLFRDALSNGGLTAVVKDGILLTRNTVRYRREPFEWSPSPPPRPRNGGTPSMAVLDDPEF